MNLSEVGVGSYSFLTFHLWGFARGGCQGVIIFTLFHFLSSFGCFSSSSGACFGVVRGKFMVCKRARCPAHSMHITECTRVIPCISDVPFVGSVAVQIWHEVFACCFPKWHVLKIFLYLCNDYSLSVDVKPKYDCIGRISPCINLTHGNFCYDVR